MKLAHRYAIVFLIVMLVSGAVLFATFDAHRTDVTDNEKASVEERVQVATMYLDDRIQEQQQVVEHAAAGMAVTDHGSAQQLQSLESFVESTAFDGVSVVDETGELQRLFTGDGEQHDMVGADLSDRQYVERALAGEQYISKPIMAETGNQVIVMSAPLYVDGEINGSINGAYYIDETELFDPLVGDDERTAVTVESNGQTLYSDLGQFDETITASSSLETVDWTVTIHRNQQAVDRSVDRLVRFQAILGLVLLGSFVLFGGWVYRSQIHPINLVLGRLGALKRRDYDVDTSLSGAAEWGEIDDALDQLAASLSRREQMLLVLNRILRHNLRNTLNVVRGRAEDLESAVDEPHREDASKISQAADDLLLLADRARTTERLLDPAPELSLKTDVTAVVRDRVEAFEKSEQSVSITVSAPDQIYALCGAELDTAIDELLQNVADHAGPAPSAEITIAAEDERVRIQIEDDGAGIPQEEAAVVSGEQTITQVHHGPGIGLWLVNWIVRRYDGTFRIVQDAGTAVEITLPRATSPDTVPPDQAPRREARTNENPSDDTSPSESDT